MLSKVTRKFRFSLVVVMLAMVFVSVFSFSMPAYATSEEQAMVNLTKYVYGNVSSNSYTLDEGGSLKGSDLFEGSPTKGYDLIESQFIRLSSKAQEQLVSDIALYSNKAVEDDTKAKGVEESTVSLWWKQLQTKQGVGSKFMTEILKNTKPDFVTANQIYQPFSGLVGTILGLIAVLIMSALAIVMVSDIAYIALPPVRMLVSEKRDGKNGKGSLLFSYDATHAVEIAENSSGDGESKQALGIYFKRRVVMLILLGVCLLYLVSGNIYTLVGYILDLVSGFLGF